MPAATDAHFAVKAAAGTGVFANSSCSAWASPSIHPLGSHTLTLTCLHGQPMLRTRTSLLSRPRKHLSVSPASSQ